MKKKKTLGPGKGSRTGLDWALLLLGAILGTACMLARTDWGKIITFVALAVTVLAYLWRNDPMETAAYAALGEGRAGPVSNKGDGRRAKK